MLKFVMRESQKQGAKRRIGLSNVQTCHAWWSGCWYVCCLRLNGLSILPQLYDCRVLCGSKEEILCEEDRDLELQLLNAVKVRNSDKNNVFFFFVRGVSYQLLGADLDTTKTQTASETCGFSILISGNSGPCCREWPWRTRVSRSAETALSVNFTSQGFCP